jgi:NAD(P)-dependent dehydrogenase (short-subunit alcohol dehydrogenase family)
VHAIDILPNPEKDSKSEFFAVAQRAKHELNTQLHYHQSDVRDVPGLNKIVEGIADQHGRLNGLIAAAGINHETPALEYSGEEVDRMLGINVKGAFVTAQAVARQMIRLEIPGSICMIASMSAAIANKGMTAP